MKRQSCLLGVSGAEIYLKMFKLEINNLVPEYCPWQHLLFDKCENKLEEGRETDGRTWFCIYF